MNEIDAELLRLVKFIDRKAHDGDIVLREGITVRVTRLGLQTRLELKISRRLVPDVQLESQQVTVKRSEKIGSKKMLRASLRRRRE